MALIKEKTLDNGCVGNYWKIINVHYSRITALLQWEIALFTSQAVSQAHGQNMGLTKTYSKNVALADFPVNPILEGYTFIKTQAAVMITTDIAGNPLDVPYPYDADLNGATDS